jgi:hypothetical protein
MPILAMKAKETSKGNFFAHRFLLSWENDSHLKIFLRESRSSHSQVQQDMLIERLAS